MDKNIRSRSRNWSHDCTTNRSIFAVSLYQQAIFRVLTNNMELQTHRGLPLLDLSAELIHEAEENLFNLLQRAEQILNDSELALDILAFSQYPRIISQNCNTLQIHGHTSTFKLSSDAGTVYPRLRRCQKYAELRDASQSIVETQRLEI